MITREQKKAILAELVEKFKKAQAYYLVDFSRMTVADAIRFRRVLREKGLEYKVAKNTFIRMAIKETGQTEIPAANLFGQTGVIFSYDDPVEAARIIKKEYDASEKPVLKAAVLESTFYDGSRLKELAALPNKADIIASVIGSIQAPISGIVGSINAVMRDLAYVIEEVAKKQDSAA